MSGAKNIQDVFDLTVKEWARLVGKKVHLDLNVGQIREEVMFLGFISHEELLIPNEDMRDEDPVVLVALYFANKVRFRVGNRIVDLFWGDIAELWPIEGQED